MIDVKPSNKNPQLTINNSDLTQEAIKKLQHEPQTADS
jgi:hypothetical protein